MFLETVRSEGLAHLSYVLGEGGQAAVIDPRRDVDVYLDVADRHGARITHVFETHRNEDYVVGSCDLARATGAEIHHGARLDFAYGIPTKEGEEFALGSLRLLVLETPGHTLESLSFALVDTATAADVVAVFTGDALFVGDVGRTDFYPERTREVAGLLYDSLFGKLLPLGDHVVLLPAHGAGSVCGSGMAERELSTLGYERRNNPRLQLGREAFVRAKEREHHDQPPYFRRMEECNRRGPDPLSRLPRPRPCGADEFAAALEDGLLAVDVRSPEAACGALVPGSLAIPLDMLPGFAGWLLPYDRDIGLVTDGSRDVETAVRYLVRLGYERIVARLDEGLHAWEVSGRPYHVLPALHVSELERRMREQHSFTLLDVRGEDEVRRVRLRGATHVYVGELPRRLDELPAARPVTTFCGSGRRAVIAASILRRHGIEDVEVCLGSLAACRAVGCDLAEVDDPSPS